MFFSERRRIQLRNWDEREKQMTPTPPRRQRLKFSPEVALLEATSRGDAAEGKLLMHFFFKLKNLQNILYSK